MGIQIGTLALEAGIITKDQLNFALSLQRSNDRRPIGEILVGSGLIRPGLRDRLLGVQAARLFGVSRGS